MGAATLVLTESLRDLIERQRGTSTSQTAVAIRSRSNHSSHETHDGQRSATRANRCMGSFPLFDHELEASRLTQIFACRARGTQQRN